MSNVSTEGAAKRTVGTFANKGLYKLIVEKLPGHCDTRASDGNRRVRLNVKSLADKLGFSRQTFYRSMNENKITPRVAKALIKESNGQITKEELRPFLAQDVQALLTD